MKLKVKISPNAKSNEIIGWFGDQLKIKIAAVPEKGKANKELISFLSSKLDLPRSSFEIIHGHTSSEKLLKIEGVCEEYLNHRLDIDMVQDLLV